MKKYLFLAFCFTVISCKSSTEPTSTSTDVIMPLAVGNEWDYAGLGGTPTSIQYTDTVIITAKIFSAMDTNFSTNIGLVAYKNLNDGLWYQKYFLGYHQIFLAKYPAKPGDIFTHDTSISYNTYPSLNDTATADAIVDSINAIVAVPAGTFTCYKYRHDYYSPLHKLKFRQNIYYAVNIGLIEADTFFPDPISQQLVLNDSRRLTKVILH